MIWDEPGGWEWTGPHAELVDTIHRAQVRNVLMGLFP